MSTEAKLTADQACDALSGLLEKFSEGLGQSLEKLKSRCTPDALQSLEKQLGWAENDRWRLNDLSCDVYTTWCVEKHGGAEAVRPEDTVDPERENGVLRWAVVEAAKRMVAAHIVWLAAMGNARPRTERRAAKAVFQKSNRRLYATVRALEAHERGSGT